MYHLPEKFSIERNFRYNVRVKKDQETFPHDPSFLPPVMNDFERKGPQLAVVPRYSSTIPPERRGHTSGTFRFDLTQKLQDNPTYEGFTRLAYCRDELMSWTTTAVLLKSFDTWDLLPPEARERDSEEQRILMKFVADGVTDPGNASKKKLPSPEAIMVELARILLGTIDEWNELTPTIQQLLEHEMIVFIGQHHDEMNILREEKEPPARNEMVRRLESNHILAHKASNHAELVEAARQKVIAKIVARLVSLLSDLDYEGAPSTPKGLSEVGETTYVDIEQIEKTFRAQAQNVMRAAEPPPVQEKRDTIPASPMAKRRSNKPQPK